MFQDQICVDEQRKIYYRSRYPFLVAGLALLSFVLHLQHDLSLISMASLWYVVLILMAPIGSVVWLIAEVFGRRMVVSPEGIEYHDVAYHIKADWDSIEQVKTVQIGLVHFDVLVLRQPALQKNRWLGWTMGWSPTTRMECDGKGIPLEQNIPVGWMFPKWRESGLGQEITYHIPKCFGRTEN